MTYLKGYVDHIRFRNEDNGYTVLSLDVDGDEETVVGLFPFLNEGEYLSLIHIWSMVGYFKFSILKTSSDQSYI